MSAPSPARRRRLLVPLLVGVALLATSCLPTPPGTYNPNQFPPGQGPNLYRGLVFKGLGAWWDVYDWSPTFTNGAAPFRVADVDRLAASGVQTLYIQTSTYRHPAVVLDQSRLKAIIARAHQRGMKVVGWYLPQHLDVAVDYLRLAAMVPLGVDGIGVDIESTDQPNVAVRSDNLVFLTHLLRANFPNMPMAAIPVTPVIWEELNRSWWPNFPYKRLAPYYDVWMPMAYFTYRTPQSGWRDAYRYVYESVVRTRRATGVKWLPVHPIGGIANLMNDTDVARMAAAMRDTTSIGGSLYDDRTTPAGMWPALQAFRR